MLKPNEDEDPGWSNWNRTSGVKSPGVEVVFDGIESRLCQEIEQARMCFGCVAWLTSGPILTALQSKERVSILIQKEDLLRPDGDNNTRLRDLYDALPVGISNDDFNEIFVDEDNNTDTVLCNPPHGILSELSRLSPWETNAVRCLGNYNSKKSPSFPRMHHKFMLFVGGNGIPYRVATGSYNYTRNATNSFENVVLIDDRAIVDAFWDEWAYLFTLSEPLDWTSEWVRPELRLGVAACNHRGSGLKTRRFLAQINCN